MSSKARDALNQLLSLIDNGVLVFSDELDPSEVSNAQYQIDKADEALDEPLRNCDIGTADEQTKRFREFCSAHKYLSSDFSYICKGFGKGRCPFSNSHTKSACELAWSQMPYKGKMKE
jgi:hypothetical protein